MAQAMSGQAYLAQYCRRMVGLNAHLSINHHLAMHFAVMIKLFGPVYGWWLFAFERFNGMLERVNINGHDGGELETTLLRNWVLNHLIYELLLILPPDAPQREHDLIYQIIENEARRGSMAVEIAQFHAEASVDNISLPKQISTAHLNLHAILLSPCFPPSPPLAEILFQYGQQRWPQLRRQFTLDMEPGCVRFYGNRVARRLPYIRKDGLRYGSRANNRTEKDSYAFIQEHGRRVPVALEDIFLVKVEDLNEPAHACILIRRLLPAPADLHLPWQA
ncbi:hypothetical protein EST38_g14610 [Candolleomyces aberdarensis]|uniref:Uncharacterized protein n=1 Tax=Candolleomyces aberdarensis TaxID=2316362 RepID=A0A4Q2CZH7_9AGAR|nr:hypothetical protein EST38_g14610 [Candolleomyces aberdarensis]